MNWDGKRPFIPSNIQATALGAASATQLWAGREHRGCVCHARSMCPSPDPAPQTLTKAGFIPHKNPENFSKQEFCCTEESRTIFFNWYYHHRYIVKPIKDLTLLCESRLFVCTNPRFGLCPDWSWYSLWLLYGCWFGTWTSKLNKTRSPSK